MKIGQKITIGYIRATLNILALISKKRAARKAFKIFCTPFRKSKKKAHQVFQSAEKLSFKQDGFDIHGHRWNHPRQHKILLLHGFESTSFNFDRYIIPLIKMDVEVIAFDAPAHGVSEGSRINLPMYVNTIRLIDEQYGKITGFLAHSFGGLALMHYLETVPHNENRRAVLIAPATETTSVINSFFDFLQLSIDFRKEFDELIYETGGAWPDHYSIRRAVKQIQSKVLWFHDEDDELTPLEDALKVREEENRNLHFVITKGLGHKRIYRENKIVNEAIEFLMDSGF